MRAALIVHGSPPRHYHGKGMLERHGGSTMETLPECWQKAKVVESIGIVAAIGSAKALADPYTQYGDLASQRRA